MPSTQKACSIWRKNRLAARIILRSRASMLSSRDIRIASALAQDKEIADYLLDQAMGSVAGAKR